MPKKSKVKDKRETRSSDKACANKQIYGRSAKVLSVTGFLPTWADVDLAVEAKLSVSGVTERVAVNSVASDLTEVWANTTIIKVSPLTSVIRKIWTLRTARKKFLMEKSLDSRTNTARYTNKRGRKQKGKHRTSRHQQLNLVEVCHTLFDISSCGSNYKIPKNALAFYQDQKGLRQLRSSIHDYDDVVSKSKPSNDPLNNCKPQVDPQSSIPSDEEDEEEEEEEGSSKDPEYCPGTSNSRGIKRRKKSLDPNLLALTDHRNLSIRAAADVHNMYNPDTCYSAEGFRQALKRARNSAVRDFTGQLVLCLMFDERKDKTRDGSGDFYKEEHCAVNIYPGGHFAGHFCPKGGKGKDLSESLLDFLADRNISVMNVVALATDGCEKMVGWLNGVHVWLEKYLQRPLQRILCFFHHLENVFGAVFKFYGSNTTSPTALEEPWNSLLSGDVHKRPVVDFQVVPNPELLDFINTRDKSVKLSSDHEILLGLTQVILTGELNKFVTRKIGPLVHSRFVTKETRLMRCYISEASPDEPLIRMVSFLIFVWLPVFTLAKCRQESSFAGPNLLLMEIQLGKKHMHEDEFTALLSSICWNGEFGHHENILLAMLCSSQESERALAVQIISGIRSESVRAKDSAKLRPFGRREYEVSPNASQLSDLNILPISDAKTEPPFTKHLTDDELKSILDVPLECCLPLTTVSAERAVKEVTRVSLRGAKDCRERDGIIFQSMKARKASRFSK